uniref:ShKT domain-containing protein n=1 Tax=Caenorhabditis tropicalis TaxID=1561998 RepID=A0A1I7TDU2_9PELO
MLPNGTFINPPLPKYEKLDDTTYMVPEVPTVIEYPMAHMEELIPEPQRIWPEPEPVRIQPISVYSPYSIVPLQQHTQYYPWSQPIGLTSSLDSSRRSPQNFFSSSYSQYPQYPDEKINSIVPSIPPTTSFENQMQLIEPFLAPGQSDLNPKSMSSLINLLGCKDKDEIICKHITADTCLSRPGYYLKLCPVTCKNCSGETIQISSFTFILSGFQCIDSIKIDCAEVKAQGACKLSVASEYCPRTCEYCNPPSDMAQNMSDCKDELDTCDQLAESGACKHDFSKSALRLYCAKSCGFCKIPQFYFSDSPLMASVVSTRKLMKSSLNRRDRFMG